MKSINVGKSKLFLESLNESSAKKCKLMFNKNVMFRGESNSIEFGSVMCLVAVLKDINENYLLEILTKLKTDLPSNDRYFAIWTYWGEAEKCCYFGNISDDKDVLATYANSILLTTGLAQYLTRVPQKSLISRGISIKNGSLSVADSVRVTRLVL